MILLNCEFGTTGLIVWQVDYSDFVTGFVRIS